MYRLKIKLNSNKHFSYNTHLLNTSTDEITIYYDYRAAATIRLRVFYNELINSKCNVDMNYLEYIDMLKEFVDYLVLIIDKIPTFKLTLSYEDVEFIIELAKVMPAEFVGGGLTFTSNPIQLELIIDFNFKNDLDLTKLIALTPVANDLDNEEFIRHWTRFGLYY